MMVGEGLRMKVGWMMPDVKLEGRLLQSGRTLSGLSEQKEGFGGWTARRSEIRLTGASLFGTLSRRKLVKMQIYEGVYLKFKLSKSRLS